MTTGMRLSHDSYPETLRHYQPTILAVMNEIQLG